MFIQRVRVYPAQGKGEECRGALEALVKKLQSQGLTVSLSVDLYGAEGTTFVSSSKFRDMVELDERIAASSGPTRRIRPRLLRSVR